MRILVVDDEAELVSLLIRWLSLRGHEVFGITGSVDLASWIMNTGCDLVLLDIMLPDGDGLSMVSGIVNTTAAKVIVMSGLHEEFWAGTAIKSGALDYLTKPISFEKLERILDRTTL